MGADTQKISAIYLAPSAVLIVAFGLWVKIGRNKKSLIHMTTQEQESGFQRNGGHAGWHVYPRPAKPKYRFRGEVPPALEPLCASRKWLTWDYVWNADKKKWDKPPLSAHTGRPASINNPANLGTFAEAAATAARLGLAGVGLLLTPDDGITGFDLDGCITDAGSFSETAAEVIAFGETYAEFSPSGEGIRGFALGKVEKALKADAVGVEVYAAGRVFDVTGNQIPDTPDRIADAPRTLARRRPS